MGPLQAITVGPSEAVILTLANKLSDFGASAAKLKLSVRRKVDVAAWAAEGEKHFDLRTTGRFKGYGELERIATDELLLAWRTGDGRQAADSDQGVLNYLQP